MISVSPYLPVEETEALPGCPDGFLALLQTIASHTVEGDKDDEEAFRSAMRGLLESAGAMKDAGELAALAEAAGRTFEDHCRRTNQYLYSRFAAIEKMVSKLAEALVEASCASERTRERLRELEERSGAEDVRSSLRTESARQSDTATAALEALHAALASASDPEPAPCEPAVDEVTGLPNRGFAGQAIAEAIERGGRMIAVFVADRVRRVNARYGYAGGDELRRTVRRHLEEKLRPGDRLFHWGGPVFVAILDRPGPSAPVQQELARIANARVETEIEYGRRSVTLPAQLHWTMFPGVISARLIAHRIDTFAATYSDFAGAE